MALVTPAALTTVEAGRLHEGIFGDVRSYDHRGVVFSWEPPHGLAYSRAAVDVEAKDCRVDAFGARFGLKRADFLARWTALEALAKVTDQPILSALRQYGLQYEATERWTAVHGTNAWLRRIEHSSHWVTVAVVI